MIFGDVSRLAIELELNSNSGGEWMFGRVCYWIAEHRVGDYDLGTSLRDVLFELERMYCDAGKRHNFRLIELDLHLLINTLAKGLYRSSGEDNLVFMTAIDEQWARHQILPELDVFNDWFVFLIESETIGRCVCRNFDAVAHTVMKDIEFSLKPGEFDAVLKKTIDYLNDQYSRATSRS